MKLYRKHHLRLGKPLSIHLSLTSPLLLLPEQMKLWNKYKVTSIPSLVFVDAATGKTVCRNGLLVVRDDPKGKIEFLQARANVLNVQEALSLLYFYFSTSSTDLNPLNG